MSEHCDEMVQTGSGHVISQPPNALDGCPTSPCQASSDVFTTDCSHGRDNRLRPRLHLCRLRHSGHTALQRLSGLSGLPARRRGGRRLLLGRLPEVRLAGAPRALPGPAAPQEAAVCRAAAAYRAADIPGCALRHRPDPHRFPRRHAAASPAAAVARHAGPAHRVSGAPGGQSGIRRGRADQPPVHAGHGSFGPHGAEAAAR